MTVTTVLLAVQEDTFKLTEPSVDGPFAMEVMEDAAV